MQENRLERNIIDVLVEQQIKLGYRNETIRLYYPLLSLNRFLQVDVGVEEMEKQLSVFCQDVEERLGQIELSRKGERFCFCLPPKASEYAHSQMNNYAFLQDLVETVGYHGATLDDVLQVFHNHSSQVQVEPVEGEEFDYLVYFKDGKPDDYRYCISNHDLHVIYHRFTPEDYDDLVRE